MPDFDLEEWRQRLAATYPDLCCRCKTRYADQAALEDRLLTETYTELVRHSECGHILMWRAGAAQRARQYPRPRWHVRHEPVSPAA